ncbi:MAG: ATP-binding protein [Magnetovibrionaceae bacterium]
MAARRSLALLVTLIFASIFSIGGIAVYLLADTATDQARADVRASAILHAGLIRAISKSIREIDPNLTERSVASRTVDAVRRAWRHAPTVGETGTVLLARSMGDSVAILVNQRDIDDIETLRPDQGQDLALLRALNGESGTMAGTDHWGREAIAAYVPISDLGLGLVVQIDRAEVLGPFQHAVATLIGVALVIIAIISLVLIQGSRPLIKVAADNERRIRQLADSLPIVIAAVDNRLRYIFANERYEEWFATDRSTIAGHQVSDVVGPDRWTLIQAPLESALKGKPTSFEQKEIFFPGVGRRTVQCTYLPHRAAETGEVDGLFVMIQDLTGERQTALALTSARRQAEAANVAKTEFLASMSHELRTPLNAVIGFAQMIKGQIFGPLGHDRYGEYAGDIITSGEHLLTLINDILDLSAIELGKVELEDETLNLSEIFAVCQRLVSGRADRGKVRLEIEDASQLPLIRADSRRIKQMLLNVLSNGIKFTPPEGTVGLSASRDADGSLSITVQDSGIGMSQPEIAVALQPFSQVDNMLTRRFEGTGLGLPLTKSMIEMHGGQFRIESSRGQGTSVILTLPAERIVTPDSEAA